MTQALPLVLRPVADVAAAAEAAVQRFRVELAPLLPDADVHHIGATSLPVGWTKGDVDVNLRIAPERFDAAVAILTAHYAPAQQENWTAGFASFTAAEYGLPFGIQLTAAGSADDCLLRLRDLMRTDPELLERYDACKREAAPRGADAYWEAKNAFLQSLLRESA